MHFDDDEDIDWAAIDRFQVDDADDEERGDSDDSDSEAARLRHAEAARLRHTILKERDETSRVPGSVSRKELEASRAEFLTAVREAYPDIDLDEFYTVWNENRAAVSYCVQIVFRNIRITSYTEGVIYRNE